MDHPPIIRCLFQTMELISILENIILPNRAVSGNRKLDVKQGYNTKPGFVYYYEYSILQKHTLFIKLLVY